MLSTSVLTKAETDLVFPLVRDVYPAMTLEQWRDYVSHLDSNDDNAKGLIVAKGQNGSIRGMFIFHVTRSDGGELQLIADHLIAQLLGQDLAASTLAEKILDVADQYQCKKVIINLNDFMKSSDYIFIDYGFEVNVFDTQITAFSRPRI